MSVDGDAINDVFVMYDSDEDGLLLPNQVKCALNELGLSTESRKVVARKIDLDTFRQLVETLLEQQLDQDHIQRLFALLDKDNDGRISAADIRKTTAELGQDIDANDIRDMIALVQTDGNDNLDFTTFMQILRRLGFTR